MSQRRQISKLSKIFSSPKTPKSNAFLPKTLPTPQTPANSPESPDLPTWLQNTTYPDGDFVIPSLTHWIETHNLKEADQIGKHLQIQLEVSEIDILGEILNNHYPSVDDVVDALNECTVRPTESLMSQILNRFSNNWVPAFGVFIWAKNQTGYVHSPEVYNLMVDVLGKGRNFDLIWELVNEMKDLEGYVSLVTISKPMRRLARAGMYDDAIDAFRRIEEFGLRKDTQALNALMAALAKEGSVERAYDAFMEFKDSVHVDNLSFNILIHGYCKARMPDDARKVMDEMVNHGFQPDAFAYNPLIEMYCKLKDFRSVDAALQEMQEKGCKPDVVTYTVFMHALGKAKQMKKALEVCDMAKNDGCVLDASFYSALIYILTQSGRLKDAWDIFEEMKEQGVDPGVVTYNTMITSACQHMNEENALKLLKRMEEDSCNPDIKTYAPLLKMCIRKKRIKVLKFLLNHMFKNNVSIDLGTYTLLIQGLCRNGKLELACSFYEEMVLKGMFPRDRTYALLVQELEQNNMTEAKEKVEKLNLQAKATI